MRESASQPSNEDGGLRLQLFSLLSTQNQMNLATISKVQEYIHHTLKIHHQVTLFTHISLPLSHHQVRESVAVEKR